MRLKKLDKALTVYYKILDIIANNFLGCGESVKFPSWEGLGVGWNVPCSITRLYPPLAPPRRGMHGFAVLFAIMSIEY